MSRKDFEAMAEALKEIRPDGSEHKAYAQWRKAVDAMADMCKRHNPRFDRGRFESACGA